MYHDMSRTPTKVNIVNFKSRHLAAPSLRLPAGEADPKQALSKALVRSYDFSFESDKAEPSPASASTIYGDSVFHPSVPSEAFDEGGDGVRIAHGNTDMPRRVPHPLRGMGDDNGMGERDDIKGSEDLLRGASSFLYGMWRISLLVEAV